MQEKTTSERSAGHKLALLYIYDYLMTKTDEDHPVNAAGLRRMLESHGLSEDRRTIYSDIAILEEFGLDILKTDNTKTGGWYVASRKFELPELKLLVDAVQASRFITGKKTRELIGKLETETSEAQAKMLNRQLYTGTGNKSGNEGIFYYVDGIHEAMQRNVQVAFQYGIINMKKHLVARKDGARYQVSPWALVWQDENYYLIAYDAEAERIKHFRVDKIMKLTVLEETRLGGEHFKNFDLPAYLEKTFGMYGGEDVNATLRCAAYLAGVIVERFGQDAALIPEDEGHFHVKVTVSKSPQFFGWLAGLGTGVEVVAPVKLRYEYRDYLMEIAGRHRE